MSCVEDETQCCIHFLACQRMHSIAVRRHVVPQFQQSARTPCCTTKNVGAHPNMTSTKWYGFPAVCKARGGQCRLFDGPNPKDPCAPCHSMRAYEPGPVTRRGLDFRTLSPPRRMPPAVGIDHTLTLPFHLNMGMRVQVDDFRQDPVRHSPWRPWLWRMDCMLRKSSSNRILR